jgi:hypothetical protein
MCQPQTSARAPLSSTVRRKPMPVPEPEDTLRSNKWVKISLNLFLLGIFGAIGIGALMERRWEAVPLGLIFCALGVYSIFLVVASVRTLPRRD